VPYPAVLESIGNTPLVELRHVSPNPKVRIFAKLEGQNPTGSLKEIRTLGLGLTGLSSTRGVLPMLSRTAGYGTFVS